MSFLALAICLLLGRTDFYPQIEDGITLPHRVVSVVVTNVSLREALIRTFKVAHLRCRFDPSANDIANSFEAYSRHSKDLPLHDALQALLGNNASSPVLMIFRKETDAYVIELPRVTLDVQNEIPSSAVIMLLDQSGCDYCADVSALGMKKISISFSNVSLDEAFARLMRGISPKKVPKLVFCHECYIVVEQ